MDRDSAPAENRRPLWTDMELAGREEGAPLRRRRRARVGGRVLPRGRAAARPLADDRALVVALVVARHDQPALVGAAAD
eukprot:5480727-Prymnesium_polylepis.1